MTDFGSSTPSTRSSFMHPSPATRIRIRLPLGVIFRSRLPRCPFTPKQLVRKSTDGFCSAQLALRWGEMTAPRVKDLDFARRRVNVNQNAVGVGGAFVLGTSKSHQSRSVPSPGFLSTPLKELCVGKAASSLVFGTGIAFVRPPDSRRRWWMAALKKCQIADPNFPSITRHDLRHTAASLAISAGANVKAVQRMLGHSSAAMTLDTYADLFDDDLDRVGNALDEARMRSTTMSKPTPA
ncbi:site-specific integrase [Cryobacterium lyxosi]|uniref:site-specific integrase n=1 Tax=Cryobacterium lyxosi TaxID=1259228 RepID=UPI001F5460AD|nr:site-specific integrase [Cryobacterium lyxosi]